MKMGRISLISVLMVSICASSNLVSMSSSGSDMGVAASAEHISRLVEAQIAARMARLEGKIAGYESAFKSLGKGARKSASWMPSLLTMGKVGVYLGVAGGVCYGGYCAYKKFAWLRGLVDKVIDKAKGLAQRWLDIPWIKDRLESISTKMKKLSTKIKSLVQGQEKMQEDLSKIGQETTGILEELEAGKLRDQEAAQKLQNIEQKLNALTLHFDIVS